MIGFINWNVDPEIFRIGSVAVRWYGLFFALSFYFGYLIMARIFKKEDIPVKTLDLLSIYMIVGTVVGARLGHCLFYQPDYYLPNPLEILKIWEGGLASHGAAIAIPIALYLFARKAKLSWLWSLDRIVIVVALAGFMIRMGNLMNSEIYGHATNLPWGFVFVRADLLLIPRHPTQIYEALTYLLIFIFLVFLYIKKGKTLKEGLLFGYFLVLLFSMRFIFEFLKEPQVDFENNMLLNMGQLLSIPFILIGAYILIRTRTKPFKPWPGNTEIK
ncbi:MAG: prolipoprotein diacylglyceryl transferase [Bacteroidales bacterium]